MLEDVTITQKRALAILTVIALAFGAYFLRSYFVLIVIAAVAAYLFTPVFGRFKNRFSTGLSATLTLLSSIAVVAIPVGGLIVLAVLQITQMVNTFSHWVAKTDLSALGDRLLASSNRLLAKVPFLDINLTQESLRHTMSTVGQNVGQGALHFARDSVGGLATTVTASIIFLYVFLALLVNGNKVLDLFRDLNPLGQQASDIYLAKVGAMVGATVRGQFIIAVCQGLAAALSIYIGGIHDGFFMFAIFLSALSFIPLGAGIVTIPLGIGMALFGNVVGGVFVVLFHLLVVTNIDNILRPFLVPKKAHLHPALMLLAVFAGLRMFGFWGIVLGPVIMIVIVTTISMYRAVYKGVPMEKLDDEDDTGDDDTAEAPKWWHRFRPPKRTKRANQQPDVPAQGQAAEASPPTGP